MLYEGLGWDILANKHVESFQRFEIWNLIGRPMKSDVVKDYNHGPKYTVFRQILDIHQLIHQQVHQVA